MKVVKAMGRARRRRGFTMTELTFTLVIIGVVAVVALPRLASSTGFGAAAFRDGAVGALRYAQKTAVSHRRMVCAVFSANSVELTIDHDKSGSCDGVALVLPGSNAQANKVESRDAGIVFSSVPAAAWFQTDGRITSDAAGTTVALISATIDGLSVYAQGETGYVGSAP